MKIKTYNIIWDTDGEYVNLPNSVILDVDDVDEAADKLSDKYGFCVETFSYREIKNRPNLVEVMKAVSNAMATAMDLGYNISLPNLSELVDEEDRLYTDSIWYGGSMISLRKGNVSIYIDACGDVEATLFDTTDNHKICSVKDRSNSGRFREEFSPYLKGDKEVYDLEYKTGDNRTLYWGNNNWYELFIYQDNNMLASEVVDGGIDEIMNNLDSYISWAEKVIKEYETKQFN